MEARQDRCFYHSFFCGSASGPRVRSPRPPLPPPCARNFKMTIVSGSARDPDPESLVDR